MIDFSTLSYVPNDVVWIGDVGKEPEEIIVGGGEAGPDPKRLELAKHVVADLDKVLVDAKAYVSRFIAFDRLKSKGQLYAIGLEFGRLATDPLDEFTVTLELVGDDYGLWNVTVRHNSRQNHLAKGFFPFRFCRKDW